MNKLLRYFLTFVFATVVFFFVKGSTVEASSLYFIGGDYTADGSTIIAKSEDVKNVNPYLKILNDDTILNKKYDYLYYKDTYKEEIQSAYNEYIGISYSEKIVNSNIIDNDIMSNKGLVVSVLSDGNNYINQDPVLSDYIASVVALEAKDSARALEVIELFAKCNCIGKDFVLIVSDNNASYLVKAFSNGEIEKQELASDMAFAITSNDLALDEDLAFKKGLTTSSIIEFLRNDDGEFGYQTFFKIHKETPIEFCVEEWLCLSDSKYAGFIPITNASQSLNNNFEYDLNSNTFNISQISSVLKSINLAGKLNSTLCKNIPLYFSFIEDVTIARFDKAYNKAIDLQEHDSMEKVKYFLTFFSKSCQSNIYDDALRIYNGLNDCLGSKTVNEYLPLIKLKNIAGDFGFEYVFDNENLIATLTKDDKVYTFKPIDSYRNEIGVMNAGEDSTELKVVFDGYNLYIPFDFARQIFANDDVVFNENDYLDSYVKNSSNSNIPIFVFFGLVGISLVVFVIILLVRKKNIKSN